MAITIKDVEHIAELARLGLTENEKAVFCRQLSQILDYVAKLNELDTTNIEPLSHPIDLKNVFRSDEVRPPLDRDLALQNAPKTRDGLFCVPQVVSH